MFMLTIIVVALAAVPFTGGRLVGLASVRFRASWLLAVSLGLQILVISVATEVLAHAVAQALHLLSYGVAAAFVVVNRRVPGILLAAAGGGLNLAAIGANGGVMPASASALERAGIPTADGFANSTTVADAKLAWLGDVFAIPAHWPLNNVFSVGDVVLMVGVAVSILALCGSRLTPRAAARWAAEAAALADEEAGSAPAVARAEA
jgi:hypothetical protein